MLNNLKCSMRKHYYSLLPKGKCDYGFACVCLMNKFTRSTFNTIQNDHHNNWPYPYKNVFIFKIYWAKFWCSRSWVSPTKHDLWANTFLKNFAWDCARHFTRLNLIDYYSVFSTQEMLLVVISNMKSGGWYGIRKANTMNMSPVHHRTT